MQQQTDGCTRPSTFGVTASVGIEGCNPDINVVRMRYAILDYNRVGQATHHWLTYALHDFCNGSSEVTGKSHWFQISNESIELNVNVLSITFQGLSVSGLRR